MLQQESGNIIRNFQPSLFRPQLQGHRTTVVVERAQPKHNPAGETRNQIRNYELEPARGKPAGDDQARPHTFDAIIEME
jgi:hypothetical protein